MSSPKKWQSLWQGILTPKLKSHWRWWDSGKRGEGRIVMADENLQGAQVRGLEGARFERCDFSGSTISLLDEAELVDCVFDEANLSQSSWNLSRIQGCRFHGAWLGLANFDGATVDRGDWLGAYLERSDWRGAVITGSTFRASTLTDSSFDGARFVDCNFQYANLSRKALVFDLARCPKAYFERCDFRGANLDGLRLNETTFDHCKFFDTTGKPDIEGPCTLIAPDFSSRGDGDDRVTGKSTIRDPEEVLRAWRDWDAVRINHWTRHPTPVEYEPDKQYPERRGSNDNDKHRKSDRA